jgi:hypothetical protein
MSETLLPRIVDVEARLLSGVAQANKRGDWKAAAQLAGELGSVYRAL